jgi:GNAT superfamily N-acetyltransferase
VGIHKDYRGQGIFTLFAEYLKKVIHETGMEWIDSHLELEDNWAIRKWMERLGGHVYRRHRAFIKTI